MMDLDWALDMSNSALIRSGYFSLGLGLGFDDGAFGICVFDGDLVFEV